MAISTSVVGVDPATGAVQTYVPPHVSKVPTGTSNVILGQVLNVPDATAIPAGATWTIISGTVVTQGEAQVQQVTITPA